MGSHPRQDAEPDLMQHIRECLPDLKSRRQYAGGARPELAGLGTPFAADRTEK